MKHEDFKPDSVTRYLLRQMPENERDRFEEHYFECSICGTDVTDGTRMMIAGRAVVGPTPIPIPGPEPAPNPRVWWNLPAAASLILPLLGGAVGYCVAIYQRPATEILRVARIETGVSRAATSVEVPVVRPGDALRFDVEPSDDAVAYDALVTCGGKIESTDRISREMAADAVTLRIGELPAGRCELVVQGVRKDGKRFWITKTKSPFQVGER